MRRLLCQTIATLEQFQEPFRSIKRDYDAQVSTGTGIVCVERFSGGCPVLKLQKACWANNGDPNVPCQTGIFFSVWLDKKSFVKNQILYNIHALKLRDFDGYSIKSIDFANTFRQEFVKLSSPWPNVRVDYGPLTLMQGWIDLEMTTIEADIFSLLDRFTQVSPIIDKVLAQYVPVPKISTSVAA